MVLPSPPGRWSRSPSARAWSSARKSPHTVLCRAIHDLCSIAGHEAVLKLGGPGGAQVPCRSAAGAAGGSLHGGHLRVALSRQDQRSAADLGTFLPGEITHPSSEASPCVCHIPETGQEVHRAPAPQQRAKLSSRPAARVRM